MRKDLFREATAEEIPDNVFKLIGADRMLLTAGTPASYNTMTAGWGGMGVLWGRKVSFCFVRPQRHTRGFLDRHDAFTMSFFPQGYRQALEYCGAHSGRDVDKAKATGLTPAGEAGMTWFAEARLVLQCRKLYFHDLDPVHFLDPAIREHYLQNDFHRMYIGEVIKILMK